MHYHRDWYGTRGRAAPGGLAALGRDLDDLGARTREALARAVAEAAAGLVLEAVRDALGGSDRAAEPARYYGHPDHDDAYDDPFGEEVPYRTADRGEAPPTRAPATPRERTAPGWAAALALGARAAAWALRRRWGPRPRLAALALGLGAAGLAAAGGPLALAALSLAEALLGQAELAETAATTTRLTDPYDS